MWSLNESLKRTNCENDILTKKASHGDYLLYVGLDAFVKT